ncbi:MAG TPA: polysaccharide lyase family 8 super-sandwich domain-containing protein [Capsulimonadaceae bacterium]|jgi:chondroitin AC lyase
MHNPIILFLFSLIALTILLPVCATAAERDPFDIVIERERAALLTLTPPTTATVTRYCDTLKDDGSWPDIDYVSNDRTIWAAARHLDRVKALCLALEAPANTAPDVPRVMTTISKALDYWTVNRFKNPNWWQNDIGVPGVARDILLLSSARLDTDRRAAALSILNQYGRAKPGDGANTIWEAELGLTYAMLTRDGDLAAKQSAIIAGEIGITRGDGLQSDYSYHQHGPRLQQFHYGSVYLSNTARLSSMLSGTPWAIPAPKVQLLVDMLLQGDRWMMRKSTTIPSTLDRAVSRPDGQRVKLGAVADYLAEASPTHADELRQFKSSLHTGIPPVLGFRSYPRSDFAAFQRPAFSFFVKMVSTRTRTTESINGENLKGHLLGCGDHYLLRDGEEYAEMPPVWDWSLIPGITWAQGAGDVLKRPFAGSIGDGDAGASAMDYAFGTAGAPTITAKKLWACDGDVVVCLIGGLTASGITTPLRTALDNCLERGPVIVCGVDGATTAATEGKLPAKLLRWIYHWGFAYVPLDNSGVSLETGPRIGSWGSINTAFPDKSVTRSVFMPVIEHGASPAAQSSGFAIVACTDEKDAATKAATPTWRIVSNTAALQAVAFTGGALMAAFYEPGTLNIAKGDTLTVDRPCLIFRRNGALTLADPTQTGGPITITLPERAPKALTLPADGTAASVGN